VLVEVLMALLTTLSGIEIVQHMLKKFPASCTAVEFPERGLKEANNNNWVLPGFALEE